MCSSGIVSGRLGFEIIHGSEKNQSGECHTGSVRDLAVTRGGERVASIGYDNTLRMLNVHASTQTAVSVRFLSARP